MEDLAVQNSKKYNSKLFKKLAYVFGFVVLSAAGYFAFSKVDFSNWLTVFKPPQQTTTGEPELDAFSRFTISDEYQIDIVENGTKKVTSFELTKEYLIKDTLFFDGVVYLEDGSEMVLQGMKPLARVYADVATDPKELYESPTITFLNDTNGELFLEIVRTPEVIYFHRIVDGVASSLFLQAYEITPTTILFIQNE